jgi:putative tricarboxylic transport membrane protein
VRLSLNRDVVSGLVLACLGLYIIRTALRWDFLGDDGPGPGFFPAIYGIAMFAAAAALAGNGLMRAPRPRVDEEPADRGGLIAALFTVVALAASVPLMTYLGFVVGFGIVAVAIVRFTFGKSWLTAVITATAISVSLYVLFEILLGSQLPISPYWGF